MMKEMVHPTRLQTFAQDLYAASAREVTIPRTLPANIFTAGGCITYAVLSIMRVSNGLTPNDAMTGSPFELPAAAGLAASVISSVIADRMQMKSNGTLRVSTVGVFLAGRLLSRTENPRG